MRVGTRGSALALAQARGVAAAIGPEVELVVVRVSGDQAGGEAGGGPLDRAERNGGDPDRLPYMGEIRPSGTPDAPTDKSRFVHELENRLIDGEIELAVHSAKDLPSELPSGLTLAGVPAREDPTDAWVGPGGSLEEVPVGARVGTASVRRRAQLLALRPDLRIVSLRGNVDTRLGKFDAAEVDALVLATAGLARLGLEERIAFRFPLEQMVPAPGQGALALETDASSSAASEAAARVTDRQALVELTAERAVVKGLGAGCDSPLGVCARHGGDGGLTLHAWAGALDGSHHFHDVVEGNPDQPVALASALLERMYAAGAQDLLG